MKVPLVVPQHGQKLRPEDAENLRELPQHGGGPLRRQQLPDLGEDPLRRNGTEVLPRRGEGSSGLRLDGKAQHRRKAQPPEDAQGVLPEAPRRFPHAADAPRRQVLPAMEGVPQLPPEGEGHGIDGEVPPGQVLGQGIRESDALRVAVVGVVPVPAEGGDLRASVRPPDGDRPVPQPRGQGIRPEEGQGLLRPGGGGDVPVPRRSAQEGIPYAAAHAVGLMPRALQRLQDVPREGGDAPVLSFHCHSPPCRSSGLTARSSTASPSPAPPGRSGYPPARRRFAG